MMSIGSLPPKTRKLNNLAKRYHWENISTTHLFFCLFWPKWLQQSAFANFSCWRWWWCQKCCQINKLEWVSAHIFVKRIRPASSKTTVLQCPVPCASWYTGIRLKQYLLRQDSNEIFVIYYYYPQVISKTYMVSAWLKSMVPFLVKSLWDMIMIMNFCKSCGGTTEATNIRKFWVVLWRLSESLPRSSVSKFKIE